MRKANGLPPVHPGEILREDVMPGAGLPVTAVAKALGVSRQMLHEVLAERKPVSAAMSLKLSRLFGGSPVFWMHLQAEYDLKQAERDKDLMANVMRIVPVLPALR